MAAPHRLIQNCNPLQWGHGREAMDGYRAKDLANNLNQLQWGHGREAMDGYEVVNIPIYTELLQWGHGREAMDGILRARSSARWPDFNGAMAVRPWMVPQAAAP